MHVLSGVCGNRGVVVIVLPIIWKTIGRFFMCYVGRFQTATIDRSSCVNIDRGLVFRLVLGSTVASCNDSWIIDSSGGRLGLLDWDRIVVGIRIDEC